MFPQLFNLIAKNLHRVPTKHRSHAAAGLAAGAAGAAIGSVIAGPAGARVGATVAGPVAVVLIAAFKKA